MKYFGLFVAFFLSSCAAVDQHPYYKEADAGYALISLELDYEKGFFVDTNYHNVDLLYKAKDSKEDKTDSLIYLIKYIPQSYRDAGFYEGEKLMGQVALVPLKPGEYLITEYSVGGDSDYIYSFKNEINIPFTIKPNQITYLGNYHTVYTLKRRLLGLAKVKVGAYFLVSDTHEKDLQIAKLLNPSVNTQNFDLNIPELESALSPRLVKERTTKFNDK